MEKDIYKNILVIIVGLLVINWFFEIKYLHIIILVIGVCSVFISKFAEGISWLWIKLALGLGWINSRILLSVLYYLFLVPIAFLATIFKGNSMILKDKKESLYHERNHNYCKEDLVDMW
jgi:hypothetical protein